MTWLNERANSDLGARPCAVMAHGAKKKQGKENERMKAIQRRQRTREGETKPEVRYSRLQWKPGKGDESSHYDIRFRHTILHTCAVVVEGDELEAFAVLLARPARVALARVAAAPLG